MMCVNLYNVDCLEFMKTTPDKHYSLAVVDPPYGIKTARPFSGGGKLKNRKLNQDSHIEKWDAENVPGQDYFDELFRISQNQIIFGGNYFNLPPSRCWIVWDKCQPWENFSQVELAWTSFDKPAPLFRFDNRIAGKIHPTQKPVELYYWIFERFAKRGDGIFDSHFGSGSSGIAALDMGFEMDATEINWEYFHGAKNRILEHTKQMQLFQQGEI